MHGNRAARPASQSPEMLDATGFGALRAEARRAPCVAVFGYPSSPPIHILALSRLREIIRFCPPFWPALPHQASPTCASVNRHASGSAAKSHNVPVSLALNRTFICL